MFNSYGFEYYFGGLTPEDIYSNGYTMKEYFMDLCFFEILIEIALDLCDPIDDQESWLMLFI